MAREHSAAPIAVRAVSWVEFRTRVAAYGLTVFLGAFLLFQVQPLLGKYALPWFGGSAGVWASALVFFQLFLLLGYAYAHAVARWLPPRYQAGLHLALLAIALATLPIIPSDGLRPDGPSSPVAGILWLLTLTVGAPYLLLAANGPLLQHWFAREHSEFSPYRLYALSNAASLLALLAYPVVVEPLLDLDDQAWLWSALYALFTVGCGAIALWQWRADRSGTTSRVIQHFADSAPEPIGIARLTMWAALPAVASALLVATTNRLTQEVAPVPLLWVVPLALYLASFVVTFDSDRWYRPRAHGLAALAVLVLTIGTVLLPGFLPPLAEVLLLMGNLFLVAVACHGELYARRPGVRHITLFYLALAAGGVLGGAFAAVLAPVVFAGYWEFHATLVAAAVVGATASVRALQMRGSSRRKSRRVIGIGGYASIVVVCAALLVSKIAAETSASVLIDRSFYGSLQLRVLDGDDPVRARNVLVHGRTVHGVQFLSPDRRAWHTTYYSAESGIGIATREHPARVGGGPCASG